MRVTSNCCGGFFGLFFPNFFLILKPRPSFTANSAGVTHAEETQSSLNACVPNDELRIDLTHGSSSAREQKQPAVPGDVNK